MVDELEKIIKSKKITNEQWQDIVCELIKLIPKDRYNRVKYIINKDEFKENLNLDEILKIIDSIQKKAKNGYYCYESYYDYRLNFEVVEGDRSWIDEIDIAFIGINGLFEQKKYEDVVIAYEQAFSFIEGDDDELYSLLPEFYYREEKIASKLQDHYFNYLEAIYYSKNINKIEKYVDFFEKHRYHYDKDNIIPKFCKKYDNFRNDMIEPIVIELAQEKNWYLEEIIFLLLIQKNGIHSVVKFLKENLKENMRVFKLFCNFMLDKRKYDELLESLYILEDIEMSISQKEAVYNQIINVADIMKNEKIKEKYLYKINELNPTLKYAIEICKNLSENDKIKQIEKLNEKLVISEEKSSEKILVELMLGNVENVNELYEKMETYQKEKIEKLFIYYVFKFGNNEIKEKRLLTSEIIAQIDKVEHSLDAEQILDIMNITKNNNLTSEFKEKIEKLFLRKIAQKTKHVLGNQSRENYYKIANYLVILVEHLYKEGKENEAKALLKKYQEEYKRFTSYRKCINEEITKSSIDW